MNNLRESFTKLAKVRLHPIPPDGISFGLPTFGPQAIHNATRTNEPDWLPDLNSSRWLFHIQEIMGAAMRIVDHIERGRSVLLQEADVPDRAPQLSSLAQLLMDPYYRTVVGFEILIEKEWIAQGHPFLNRCGHTTKVPAQLTALRPLFLLLYPRFPPARPRRSSSSLSTACGS